MRALWLRLVAGGLAALVVLALAGLVSLTQAPGRMLLVHLLDGRRVEAVGTIGVSGVEGNILSALTLERLTLADDQGVWLEIEGLTLEWRARSLLGDTLIVHRIEADHVTLYRRPELGRSGASGGAGGPSVRLARLLLSDLVLEESVLGDRVALRIDAEFASAPASGQRLSAEILRTDGAADRLSAVLARSPDGLIEGEATAFIPSDSPLAALVYASGREVSVQASIRGDERSGATDFLFRIDQQTGVEGQGRWHDGDWSLQAQTNANAWPQLSAPIKSLLAGGALAGEGDIETRTGRLSFSSAAGEVSAARSSDRLIDLAGQLNAQALALLTPESLSLQQLRFEARLDPRSQENWLEGRLFAEGLAHAQGRMATLEADYRLVRQHDALRFDVTGVGQGAEPAQARVQALFGDRVRFGANGTYARADRIVRFDAAEILSDGASLSGAGMLNIASREAEGRAALVVTDASRVQEGLSGPVTVSAEGGMDALEFRIEAEGLTGAGAPYALATGLTGQGRLAFTNGFALSDLDLESAYLRLNGGLARPEGAPDWQGQIDYALDTAGLGVRSVSGVIAGAASLQASPEGLSARLQAQADSLAFGSAALEAPILRVELDPEADGGLRGVWRFDAMSQERELGLEGAIEWHDGRARIEVGSARYADIAAQGFASLDAQALQVDFTLQQEGAIQLWSAALQYVAPRQDLAAGRLDASAALERFRLGGITLNTLETRLSGPMDGLAFELNAQGATSEPLTLSAGGPVAYRDGSLRAEIALDGALGERVLSSTLPLTLVVGQGEASASAGLRLGEAALALQLSQTDEGAFLDYDLSALPADLVMGLVSLPQAAGDLALTGHFEKRDDRWTGQSDFAVSDLSSASSPGLGALNGTIRLALLQEGARLTGGLREDAFEMAVDLRREGAIASPAALLAPDWRGDVRLDGDIAVLAALYMPEGEVLSGQISINAAIDGYDTSGQLSFRDGALQSALAGRTFAPIRANGVWEGGALVIERLQVGEDGKAGANAQAEFRATSDGLEGEGRIDMTQLYLVDRSELSGGATGYAEFTLRERVLTLTGEAEIGRLEVRPSGGGRGSRIAQIEVEELNRPDMLDQAYRRPIRIDLDYRLSADDRLMVSSRAFSSEWSADVHVTGTANRPRLSGEANLLSGQASLLTAPFSLTSGTVTFDGLVNQTRLSIEAQHQAPDLTVIGRVQGSVREPEVHFESTPSLPEDEILSRLLFGSGVSDLSPLQASQLAAQLSGAGWLDTMADVRAALGVDRLDVRQNGDGAITVLGGRQLTDDVYLELESGVGQALGSARIEWRLNPSLVLASEVSGDSSNEISLSWRRSFD